ncbi:MAG: DUF2190 family protein [Dehalococcoidia bacterium]|nr:DUF2190 family protein [Dehalococcoidia bacterium]
MAGWIEQPAEVGANYYLDPYRVAGEEVSSTYEGRHVYVQEVVLVHAGAGFVQKGQPVGFWEGVGIALKTATSESENVPIDTEGIWRVSVVAAADIVIGQSLYITTAGVVTDDPTNAMAIFGYSLQTVTSGTTAIIAVKVHWMAMSWNWLWWWLTRYSWYNNGE